MFPNTFRFGAQTNECMKDQQTWFGLQVKKLGLEAKMAPAVTSDFLTMQLRASCGRINILTRFLAICKRRFVAKQEVFRFSRLF